jgi:hypothetical protein
MRDLVRALHLTGRPVSVPWGSLGQYIRPRGGYLMLVLAAGGVGKSAFALEWASRLGAPALYISLDTSLVDHAVRLLARHTGATVDHVQGDHDADPEAWARKWGEKLEQLDLPVRFCDGARTAREVREVVAAETEYWGEPPAITIVDNLANILEQEEGAGEYRRILKDLHRTAKDFDTLVIALHHLRKRPARTRGKSDDEDMDEGSISVHLSDALYESDKDAQIVLGLWRPSWNQMSVGVLKNRMGPMDRNGQLHTTLKADLGRMELADIGWRSTGETSYAHTTSSERALEG